MNEGLDGYFTVAVEMMMFKWWFDEKYMGRTCSIVQVILITVMQWWFNDEYDVNGLKLKEKYIEMITQRDKINGKLRDLWMGWFLESINIRYRVSSLILQ